MRGRTGQSNRWLQIVIAVLVLAAVVFGIYQAVGQRYPGQDDLERSLSRLTSDLGRAIALREEERAGKATPADVRAEMAALQKEVQAIATKLGKADPEPTLRLTYERTSRFAGNVAKQLAALASGSASPDSAERTEARLRAMLKRAPTFRPATVP